MFACEFGVAIANQRGHLRVWIESWEATVVVRCCRRFPMFACEFGVAIANQRGRLRVWIESWEATVVVHKCAEEQWLQDQWTPASSFLGISTGAT
jgi:hypothetical protein